jgi:hypothetical protein
MWLGSPSPTIGLLAYTDSKNTTRGESYPHIFLVKKWDSAFAERRNFKETDFYVESRRRLGATGDNFDWFWKHDPDLQDAVPFSKILEVKNFCHGVSLEDLELPNGPAELKQSGWLEDRSLSCGQYKNSPSDPERLTATKLHCLLKVKVKCRP